MFGKSIAAACLLFACFASAKQAVPSFTAPLVDQAGFLSPQERQAVNERLSVFAAATRGQMAVLIIRDLQPDESLEGYSLRVAETWGVGRKKEDTGLLLLIVSEPHLLRVEVGYGWEGQINDARAGDLIRALSDSFRSGRKASGILNAINRAQTMITGEAAAQGEFRGSREAPQQLTRGERILVWGVVVIVVILSIVSPQFRLMMIYLLLSGRGGGRGGSYGGGFGGGGGGGFGGGGASGRW